VSALRVSDLHYRYGSKVALDGVGFSIDEGRFCALLGPNGAGKSTLFSLLTGLLAAPEGGIAIAGHDMRTQPKAALARMGVVFQQTTLDLDLTVAQNLRYFAALHGLSGRTAASRIDEALDRLGMLARGSEKVRALNGGHRRRTEIARALLHRPAVMLLDEPTAGMARADTNATIDLLKQIKEGGMTKVIIEHDMHVVFSLADRISVLAAGRIIAQGTPDEIKNNPKVKEAYLGEEEV
jgi:ABC-2 type transport system ATP-binding protein